MDTQPSVGTEGSSFGQPVLRTTHDGGEALSTSGLDCTASCTTTPCGTLSGTKTITPTEQSGHHRVTYTNLAFVGTAGSSFKLKFTCGNTELESDADMATLLDEARAGLGRRA